MVRRAVAAGAVALPATYVAGSFAGGRGVALSAALGVVVVVLNFAGHGLSLAWAAGISLTFLQAVAFGGFLIRMGIILVLMFALDRTAFFSPLAFGLAVVGGTLTLLVYEARLVSRGLGGELRLPTERGRARTSGRPTEWESR